MNDNLYKPLKTASLKEEFVLYMEELILKGALKPGEKLAPERDLAKKLGVSRPVIHEGIITLETRGLVTLRPRHGVVVNDYRLRGTLDLLLSLIKEKEHDLGPGLTGDLEHFRINMERDIVSLLCSKPPGDLPALKEMKKINRRMSNAEQAMELAELDFEFHLNLAIAGGNALYALLSNTLKPAHMDLLTLFYQAPDVREQVVGYHDHLIAALADRDESRALVLIKKTDSFSSYN